MKRGLLFAFLAVAVVCLFSWMAGFDFNARGSNAFLTAFISLMCGGLAFAIGSGFLK